MERFKDRVAQNPQRRKMRVIGTNGFEEECVVDILRDEGIEGVETQNGVLQTGTPLNAGSLNAILDEIDITGKIWQETGTAANRIVSIPGVTSWDSLLNKHIYIRSAADGSTASTFLSVNGIAKQLGFPGYLISGAVPKGEWVKAGEIYSVVWDGIALKVTNVLSESPQSGGDLAEIMQKIDITAKIWPETGTATTRILTIPGVASWDDLLNKHIYIRSSWNGKNAESFIELNGVSKQLSFPLYLMNGSLPKAGWVGYQEIYSIVWDGSTLHLTETLLSTPVAAANLQKSLKKSDDMAKVWKEYGSSAIRAINIPNATSWYDVINRPIRIVAVFDGKAESCSLKLGNETKTLNFPDYMMKGERMPKAGWVKAGEIYEIIWNGVELCVTGIVSSGRNVANDLNPIVSIVDSNSLSQQLRLEMVPETGYMRLIGYTKDNNGRESMAFNLRIASEELQIETRPKLGLFIEPGLEEHQWVVGIRDFLDQKEVDLRMIEISDPVNVGAAIYTSYLEDSIDTFMLFVINDEWRVGYVELQWQLEMHGNTNMDNIWIYDIFPFAQVVGSGTKYIFNREYYYTEAAYNCGAADIVDWDMRDNVKACALGGNVYEEYFQAPMGDEDFQSQLAYEFYSGKEVSFDDQNFNYNGSASEVIYNFAYSSLQQVYQNGRIHFLIIGTAMFQEVFEAIDQLSVECEFERFTVEFLDLKGEVDPGLLSYMKSGNSCCEIVVYSLEPDYEHLYSFIEASHRGEIVDQFFKSAIRIYK